MNAAGSIKVAFAGDRRDGGDFNLFCAGALHQALAREGIATQQIDLASVPDGDVRSAPSDSRPDLILSFGAASRLGAIWAAAARNACPLLHFAATEAPEGRRGRGESLLARIRASRHVGGVLGTSRSAIARLMQAGIFPGARFTRVVPPAIELPPAEPVARSSPVFTFGVHDPLGDDHALQLILQAASLAGHADAFAVKLCCPAPRAPAVLPPNVSMMTPGDPLALIETIDALIVPCDAAHHAATILMALRAGRIVIVPDGGMAAELIKFGRAGMLFTPGSAYDLALKMNMIASTNARQPLGFRGSEDVVARCSPDAVAKALGAAFRYALTSAAGD